MQDVVFVYFPQLKPLSLNVSVAVIGTLIMPKVTILIAISLLMLIFTLLKACFIVNPMRPPTVFSYVWSSNGTEASRS